mgnify:CR=1 FL=1
MIWFLEFCKRKFIKILRIYVEPPSQKKREIGILNCRLVRGGDNFKQLEFQLMRIKIQA